MRPFPLGEDIDLLRESVHGFAEKEIAPRAERIDHENLFPADLWRKFGELGLLGVTIPEEFGGSGMGFLAHMVAMEEISRASGSVGLSYGAHSNLCVQNIYHNGNDAQRRKYLPKLCSGEHVGALAMSEPGAGSDVVGSMICKAEKRGDVWVANGTKMWITNGSVADVAIVWTRTDEGIRGFAVPTDTPGFTAHTIKSKMSLRASVTSELVLEDVRLPESARLPGATSLRAPLSCLNEARFGIVFGSVGAARDCLETALTYAQTRVQFDRPIGGFQLTQQKIADMTLEYGKAFLLAMHLGRAKDTDGLRPEQVSLGKLNNVREAIAIARTARTILGASGITGEYPVMRHANNLESVLTYEGTSEMHTLVIGQALTGTAAFR